MLGGPSQSGGSSTERSRPRSRLLMMKERLRLQRQRSQQQTNRENCEHGDADQRLTSSAAESRPTTVSSTETASPTPAQSPIKGRRFQRSRHAAQQARTRSQSQDAAAATGLNKDGLLGCAGGTRPLQKSKSVDTDLETITQDVGTDRRSRNTTSADVRKRAASGSQKVEKKGSFLSRSSSLLARLSGKSGQKKLQSPSPLRHESSAASSAENADDSIGASANHSRTSSTLSKTVSSPSEAGHFEVLMSSDSTRVDGTDSRQQILTTLPSTCQPTAVHSRSDQVQERMKTNLSDVQFVKFNDRQGVCQCGALVSRADSKCQSEKATATEQGGDIVFAAEMRRWLPRQATDDWVTAHTNTEDGCSRPVGQYEASKTPGRPVSVSAGNLLDRMRQGREDFTGSDVHKLNGAAVTSSAVLPDDAMASCHAAAAAADAVTMTMTSAHQQHSQYS